MFAVGTAAWYLGGGYSGSEHVEYHSEPFPLSLQWRRRKRGSVQATIGDSFG